MLDTFKKKNHFIEKVESVKNEKQFQRQQNFWKKNVKNQNWNKAAEFLDLLTQTRWFQLH